MPLILLQMIVIVLKEVRFLVCLTKLLECSTIFLFLILLLRSLASVLIFKIIFVVLIRTNTEKSCLMNWDDLAIDRSYGPQPSNMFHFILFTIK